MLRQMRHVKILTIFLNDIDLYILQQRFQRSGFMPPGRPKHWKQLAMDVLARKAGERIMGTQALDRSDNKMWLVQHLEVGFCAYIGPIIYLIALAHKNVDC